MKAADLPTDYNMCEILEHNLKNPSPPGPKALPGARPTLQISINFFV